MSLIAKARQSFHAALLREMVLSLNDAGIPSNADKDSRSSVALAAEIYREIQAEASTRKRLAGQISGSRFEQIVRSFVKETFSALSGLRPGNWDFAPDKREIFRFEQYQHLADLSRFADDHPELAVLLGNDYVISPDIVVVRRPESDEAINQESAIVDHRHALHTGIRLRNNSHPLLHASISCKWTLRSDRAQNARSEALNLIRNRKGRLPHIAVVTGEPLPSRLASLALGTGDIDCVYHFALPELMAAVKKCSGEDSVNTMKVMVDGKRLKDIADLPFDLAV
jgi:hypothetical protein